MTTLFFHRSMKLVASLALVCLTGFSCQNGKTFTTPPEADTTQFPYVDSITARAYYEGATRIDSSDVVQCGANIRQQKKLLAFDLDGTLTQHKTQMSPEAKATLDSLGKRYQLVMVGGGGCERIYKQMNKYPIDILGNYGMEESCVTDGKFHIIRTDKIQNDSAETERKCNALRQKYGFTEYKGSSVEYHESGMLTFALLGTKADIADKLAFDPDKKKRRAMYADVCAAFSDYAVFIGGTTSFDLVKKEYNKYDAVMRYARQHGFTKDQVLFFGDDMTDGGNDSYIRLAGMDYIQVDDYATFPALAAFLYKE